VHADLSVRIEQRPTYADLISVKTGTCLGRLPDALPEMWQEVHMFSKVVWTSA